MGHTSFPKRFPWREKRQRTDWTSSVFPNVTFCIVYRAISDLCDGPLIYEQFLNLLVYL